MGFLDNHLARVEATIRSSDEEENRNELETNVKDDLSTNPKSKRVRNRVSRMLMALTFFLGE